MIGRSGMVRHCRRIDSPPKSNQSFVLQKDLQKRKEPGMRNIMKIAPLLSCVVAVVLAAPVMASDHGGLKKSGMLDQLLKQTGVYDRSKTGKTPVCLSSWSSMPLFFSPPWSLAITGAASAATTRQDSALAILKVFLIPGSFLFCRSFCKTKLWFDFGGLSIRRQ